ncbi:hypothetical protein FIU97_09200 [Roseivivax sp. THAF40]|uniref:hypothetical protein n=1 Tax=unclassified Roseivivax TaxID=2639302 RepID=UPI001268DE53|nr:MULTISPECIES: hypothetical protein [unclassified Roseivivax]QFS82976.1 hypothetical protein FIV09_09085 [Roseivivax sp. THAF197b]QFT46747.1 hypothetical protein FIU97_09200 [Roseivivax sp. THAF40]
MRLFGIIAAASLSATLGTTGSAQDRYRFEVTIEDQSYTLQTAPAVHYRLYETEPGPGADLDAHYDAKNPEATGNPNRFVYGAGRLDHVGDSSDTRSYVRVDIGQFENLLPADPTLLVARLTPNYLGGPPIKRTVVLKTRAQFAELYRLEVNQILRLSQLGEDDFERAYKAALGAIDYSPDLDNYLLFIKVLRAELDSGSGRLTHTPATREELALLLPKYSELDFGNRWLIDVDLLDTLVGARDPDRSYGTAGTVRDAAVMLGTSMIEALETADADLASLPIVRVYQHLSALHAGAGDCISLSENAARALADADEIRMAWSAQRRLFLDWATCLEQMSGFGTGPDIDTIIADAAEKPFLKAQWSAFAEAGQRAGTRLEFATAAPDVRIRDLKDISLRISERSPE